MKNGIGRGRGVFSTHGKLHGILHRDAYCCDCDEKKRVCTHIQRECAMPKAGAILAIRKSRQIGFDLKRIAVETECKENVGEWVEGDEETSE